MRATWLNMLVMRLVVLVFGELLAAAAPATQVWQTPVETNHGVQLSPTDFFQVPTHMFAGNTPNSDFTFPNSSNLNPIS